MSRFRLTVEYQGTRYRGWQAQTNARSVQGELLAAAGEAFGPGVDIQGAGRTDAGVHALGQVAHLGIRGTAGEREVVQALNDLLPPDIAVIDALKTSPRFHARHDALSRSYLYQISRRRTALGKAFVWWVKDRLEVPAMARALEAVKGRHDFAAFADGRLEKDQSTVVVMEEATVAEAGDLILVRCRASHFLWKMVRRLVGTLAEVGRGRLQPREFEALLTRGSTYPAAHTAPPSGLFLEEVLYPGEKWRRPLLPVLDVAPGARRTRG